MLLLKDTTKCVEWPQVHSQKSHKVNRRNLRLVVCTVHLGPPKGTESDNIYWFKQVTVPLTSVLQKLK